MHVAGSALQNLSADEEVLEKEFEAIPRLKSSLNIKSKPKTKHQKGTYRRGRAQGKTAAPTSNDPRVLTAAPTTVFGSASFDLDLSDSLTLDSGDEPAGVVTLAEGSLLAPSKEQADRYLAEASGRRQPADRARGGNGVNGDGSEGGKGSAQRVGMGDEGQQEGAVERVGGGGNGQGDWEGPGANGSRRTASNALARQSGQEQVAARLQEPLPEEPQGYSLMWCASHDQLDFVFALLLLLEASFRRIC